jgi:hypothetical protein
VLEATNIRSEFIHKIRMPMSFVRACDNFFALAAKLTLRLPQRGNRWTPTIQGASQ